MYGTGFKSLYMPLTEVTKKKEKEKRAQVRYGRGTVRYNIVRYWLQKLVYAVDGNKKNAPRYGAVEVR